MLVCNDTPFFHGTKLTSRRPGQLELMLVVRGSFRLVPGGVVEAIEGIDQGFLTGETFADDDAERAGQALTADDFADFKLTGEVMLLGSCHPPKKPATQCPVRLGLGAWHKDLVVHGDRTWKRGIAGDKPGEPAPFERMPIDFEHAFGGPDLPNPVGRGLGDRVPNVEVPAAQLAGRDQRPPPGCFGPVNANWAPRNALRGTNYGRDYLKNRAPFFADDFDWTHFNAALPDQRLAEGYFRGDEPLTLVNLHPEHAKLQTELPSLRIRAFARDDRGDFRAIVMQLDTVVVEPDEDRVLLTWRGHTPVREDDFEDVAYLLVASEPLESALVDEAHYRDRLDAFIADPTGVLAAIPPEMMEAYERGERDKQGLANEPLELDPELDPMTGTLKATFGSAGPQQALDHMAASVKRLEEVPDKTYDLGKMVADADEARRKQAPPQKTLKLGSLPPVHLRKRLRPLVEKVRELRAKEEETGETLKGLDALEKVPFDPRLTQLDPDYTPPVEPLSTDEPGPGANLRERDLSDRDLAGIDLSGADLREADLSRANLKGANLAGAKLRKATLYQATVEGADLTGADLTLVNAIALRGEGADFSGATMSESDFEYARLKGATLDGATADYVVFVKADLREVSARGATLDHSDFSKTELGEASLREATGALCSFAECDLRGADLRDGRFVQATFADADLTGANLLGARADKAFFMGATLDTCDLRYSSLVEAHFTKASLVAAKLFGANVKQARLYRAKLDGADFSYANLMSADLRKASIEAVRFVSASLYDAKLLQVSGAHYVMDDANTELMLLEEKR